MGVADVIVDPGFGFAKTLEQNYEMLARLNALRYIAVFSFIVAEPYRHTRLNYDMIMHLWPDLQAYDFVFIPVMHHLKTHNYWKRWGAVEFFRDAMSVYYMLPLSLVARQVVNTMGSEHA